MSEAAKARVASHRALKRKNPSRGKKAATLERLADKVEE